MLSRKRSAEQARMAVNAQMACLRRLLTPETRFLEIGPGDCALSVEVARRVATVIAVDVSDEVTRRANAPSNFRLCISDGRTIPADDGSVDLAYSNQLIEHLHPEDVSAQLAEVHRVLEPGGRYLCITPHRMSGPHDVSGYFDDEPRGFHLREYSAGDLVELFRAAGFSRVELLVGLKQRYARCPLAVALVWEALLSSLPRRWQQHVASRLPSRLLTGDIRLLATR